MKTIINFNIRGTVFQIEEDAYQKLKSYLDSIENHFKGSAACDEILNDIELRIVELFQQQIAGFNKVLSSQDVETVMAIMGTPADFDDADSTTAYTVVQQVRRKRLFRDMDHRMIGGVCSGLSAYFDFDASWIRLAFVVITISGLSPLVYILLWIVIPPARTIAEKLEMYGAPVNISNMEKALKEEMGDLRDKFSEFAGKAKSTFKRR